MLFRSFLLLGQPLVLGLGHRPEKQTSDELLGPISLQYTTLHLLQQPKSFRRVIEIYIFDKMLYNFVDFNDRENVWIAIYIFVMYFFFFLVDFLWLIFSILLNEDITNNG